VLQYLYTVAGDFTSGFTPVVIAVLVVALVGARAMWLRNRDAAYLTACVVLVPTAAFIVARFGQSTSPESRHLIFVLPFFALLVALGLIDLSRGRTAVLVAAIVVLMSAEVAWGWEKTAPLYRGEQAVRVEAREAASAWLARTSRADDVLFGYDPLFLGAWERDRTGFPDTAIPRADAKLALRSLREAAPLGRGVWVFDASDTTNAWERQTIRFALPTPASAFDGRAYGPYLVIRSRQPLRTRDRYLTVSEEVMRLGRSLEIGDADVNLHTMLLASRRLRPDRAKATSVIVQVGK
jgi:hypothetical protein